MSEHDGYRLSVRFGEEILARGHTAIPNLVLNYYVPLGLTGSELLFTIHVWQHWWSDRDPYPSLRTIATRMGISLRQAKRYVESLEHKGFLRVVERFLPDGSQTTNEFDYSPLIRAVVDAARAGGALDPSAAPAIVRRSRSRLTPGDGSVTPPPDTTVTPTDAGVVTPAGAMPATAPRSATSPKEDAVHAHAVQTDGGTAGNEEPLAELLDLFVTVADRVATAEEHLVLAQSLADAAPLAARATPPASGEEWVAAALVELAEQNGAVDLADLAGVLARFAAVDIVPPPAAPMPRSKAAPVRQATSPVHRPVPESAPVGLVGVWHATLDDLREQIVPANFSRWLARTRLVSQSAGQAVVGVPDQVSAEQLARRFDPIVRRALADACGEAVTVRYEVLAS
ncbi:MAG: helix-turn-helix domain-containing protein [Chloroflexota bacterium]